MANFIVKCNNCLDNFNNKEQTAESFIKEVLFETTHKISATDIEIELALTCPRCSSVDCEKTFVGYDVVGYIHGNGYLDTAGAKRDMNVRKLVEDDPYGEYRMPGEVEDLKVKLTRACRIPTVPVDDTSKILTDVESLITEKS